jgi:hypothetical protein
MTKTKGERTMTKSRNQHPKNLMIARQGDVGILKVEANPSLPGRAKTEQPREGGRLVLAHGEVTGHAHAISALTASLYVDDSVLSAPDAMQVIARIGGGVIPDRLLKSEGAAALGHEEHEVIPSSLLTGDKVVRIQREYAGSQRSRSAAD